MVRINLVREFQVWPVVVYRWERMTKRRHWYDGVAVRAWGVLYRLEPDSCPFLLLARATKTQGFQGFKRLHYLDW
jgi:hypothetical protein